MASWFRAGCLVIGLLSVSATMSGKPNMTPINTLCSDDRFEYGEPYGLSVSYVLTDLASKTSKEGYDYYDSSRWSGTIALGHGACNGALSNADCDICMRSALGKLDHECPKSTGGQVQLQDCRIRYESYPLEE